MYNLKSPPEKIQALFFQALLAADPKLKPSDIQVTVVPDEAAAKDAKFKDWRCIKIDLSKTMFAKHVKGLVAGGLSAFGSWTVDPENGTIEYHGDGAMEKATVPKLQAAMGPVNDVRLYNQQSVGNCRVWRRTRRLLSYRSVGGCGKGDPKREMLVRRMHHAV